MRRGCGSWGPRAALADLLDLKCRPVSLHRPLRSYGMVPGQEAVALYVDETGG